MKSSFAVAAALIGAAVADPPAVYTCNPAHVYPGGQKCVSTDGTLALITPSATSSSCSTTAPYASATITPTIGHITNATASAPVSDVWTTAVVTAYTTYCPVATTLTVGPHTYTVSSATTLTITQCPGGCTISTKVPSTWSAPASGPPAPESSSPVPESSAPAHGPPAPESSAPAHGPPAPESSAVAPPPYVSAPSSGVWSSVPTEAAPYPTGPAPAPPAGQTGTAPAAGPAKSMTKTVPVGPTGTSVMPTQPAFTGAASSFGASGAALAGLMGVLAFAL